MSTEITQSILDTFQERPNIVLLMSGNGSNAKAILGDEEIRDRYNVSLIATDNSNSAAERIGEEHSIEVLTKHVSRFDQPSERSEYFEQLLAELSDRNIQGIFYAGFMKIVTARFCESVPGINVHPADLSIVDNDGLARYRGMKAMSDMRRDLGFVRSTVHVADVPVDSGTALSLSDVVVSGDETDEELHQTLKLKEHAIFTGTIKLLGRGAIQFEDMPLAPDTVERMLDE